MHLQVSVRFQGLSKGMETVGHGGHMKDRDFAALQRRLANLGRRRPQAAIQPDRPSARAADLPEGKSFQTPSGEAIQIEKTYLADDFHGHYPLSHLFSYSSEFAAQVARKPELESVPLRELVFLDTETTGLVGGAGTLVFLVGVGRFVGEHFVLRQYFMRDPAQEMGMLDALQGELESAPSFVTYNGQSFDLPMLENRYIIALKRRLSLLDHPNLDLLQLARRLWRNFLPDCSLSTVEARILGVRRTEEDIPSSWIPGIYLDYLRTGDISQINGILYHNLIDVLSLVVLAGQVLARYGPTAMSGLSGAEALAVARWHEDLGRDASAETAFKRAIATEDRKLRGEALRRYTEHLRKDGRKSQAVEGWEAWHQIAPSDHRPCIELAKYYEWDTGEIERAIHWAEAGLQCLSHWPMDWRRRKTWAEIEHRLQRLAKKRNGGEPIRIEKA